MHRRELIGAGLLALTGSWPAWGATERTILSPWQSLEHGWQIGGVDFSRDGRFLASGSADRTAKVWNAHTGAVSLLLPEEC